MHAMAQELCIAYEKESYIYGKSVDALGILSYAGEIRRAAVLMLTDFNLKMARGGSLGGEAAKSLFDVIEGGSIQDTRYRPALFPPSLPRVIAVNDNEQSAGNWFMQNELYGIGMALQRLADRSVPDPVAFAATGMKEMNADQQATARRVSFALCPDGQFLIRDETRARLMDDTTARAAAALARRRRFWNAQDSIA